MGPKISGGNFCSHERSVVRFSVKCCAPATLLRRLINSLYYRYFRLKVNLLAVVFTVMLALARFGALQPQHKQTKQSARTNNQIL